MPSQWPILEEFLSSKNVSRIPHLNTTNRFDIELESDVKQRIEELYARDMALYRRTTSECNVYRSPLERHHKPARASSGSAPARVAWISHRYGYSGDLMYFGRIFAGFVRGFPCTRIYVDPATRKGNGGLLRWFGSVQFFDVALRRTVNGAAYDLEVRVPNPWFAVDLLGWSPSISISDRIHADFRDGVGADRLDHEAKGPAPHRKSSFVSRRPDDPLGSGREGMGGPTRDTRNDQ